MTDDQIIQWAREAGIHLDGENQQQPLYVAKKEELKAFANLVRNAVIDEAVAYVRNQGFGAIASDAMAERLKS